jgi:hypothetical protein
LPVSSRMRGLCLTLRKVRPRDGRRKSAQPVAAGGGVHYVSPLQGSVFEGRFTPGQRSPTRFSLGFHILPFQGG